MESLMIVSPGKRSLRVKYSQLLSTNLFIVCTWCTLSDLIAIFLFCSGNKTIPELLIDAGANVNAEDIEKNTPLHWNIKAAEGNFSFISKAGIFSKMQIILLSCQDFCRIIMFVSVNCNNNDTQKSEYYWCHFQLFLPLIK